METGIPPSAPCAIMALPRGAVLPDAVLAWMRSHHMHWAWIQGIGAVKEVEIAYYDLAARAYRTLALDGVWEVLHLTGNVTEREGDLFLHAHLALGDAGGHVRGGHLVRARVAVTLELVVIPSAPVPPRQYDEEVGLWLLPRKETGGSAHGEMR